MKPQDIISESVSRIAPTESVGMAAKKMSETAVGCLVVTVNANYTNHRSAPDAGGPR